MMRKVGQIMGQARAMAKEFQQSFDEIGRETELAELRKEIEALKKSNPVEEIRGEVDKVAYEARFGGEETRRQTIAAPGRAETPDNRPERGDG